MFSIFSIFIIIGIFFGLIFLMIWFISEPSKQHYSHKQYYSSNYSYKNARRSSKGSSDSGTPHSWYYDSGSSSTSDGGSCGDGGGCGGD